MGKYHSLMMHIALILLMTGVALGIGIVTPAFAAEDGTVLQVCYDDKVIANYTKADLNGIWAQEGSRTYYFSGMNTYPTPEYLAGGVTGATVNGILEDAFANCTEEGVPAGLGEMQKDQIIEIRESSAKNAYRAVYTIEQFQTERYCFPNVSKEAKRSGAPAREESWQGKQVVPAVITLEEADDPAKTGRFLIGQTVPNEQNKPEWVQGMISSTEIPGQIIIRSEHAQQWNALTKTDADTEGNVAINQPVTLDRDVNDFKDNGGGRYWVYYTTDGTEPTKGSAIYNCNNYDFGETYEFINKPVFKSLGPAVLKAKVYGNGKLDSETKTFQLNGIKDFVDVEITGNCAQVVDDGLEHQVQGFEFTSKYSDLLNIMLIAPGTDFAAGKTVGEYQMGLERASFDITLTDPEYRLRQVRVTDGSLTILPKNPSALSASAADYQSCSLRWAAVNGAAGYEVFRSTSKSSGFGKVATIDGAAVLTATDRGLKTGTAYYYKVRAYGKSAKGEFLYGSFSPVVKVTPALAKPTIKAPALKGKTITVRWTAVPGASGYQIYRSMKKKGKYTLIRTVRNGKTVSFKNAKLKKKKTYYYKVRAYRTVSGRNVYGGFSAVKYKKVK